MFQKMMYQRVMIQKIFWQGLTTLIPLLLTIALVIWAFSMIENFFGEIVKMFIPINWYFRGLGLILGIIVIFIVGIIMNVYLAQRLYVFGETLMAKIPVVKTLYSSLKDLLGFFNPQHKKTGGFPVLIETNLGKVIGFITVDNPEHLPGQLMNDQELVAVYIPLSYQIGGLTIFVPRTNVTALTIPVDKAMSFVLTAGMTGKQEKSQ